jgi:hypothetical protein
LDVSRLLEHARQSAGRERKSKRCLNFQGPNQLSRHRLDFSPVNPAFPLLMVPLRLRVDCTRGLLHSQAHLIDTVEGRVWHSSDTAVGAPRILFTIRCRAPSA